MPVNFAALTAPQAAEMFGVSEKTVRNWMNDNGLPFSGAGRGRTVNAAKAIEWHHEYAGGKNGKTTQPEPEVDEESYDDALARKTRAEADLKELQLARERGQVAAIADVEKVITAANLAAQTQLLAMPARLSTQILGLEDPARAVAIVDSEVRHILTNLADIDAVREAAGLDQPAEDEE